MPFRPTTAVLCAVPVLTGYLGVWQVQRLNWKLALIDDVERNLSREALVLPDEINEGALVDYAFRRVLLHGHFTQPIMLVGPRTYEGVGGYHLIQPFVREQIESTLKPKKRVSFWKSDRDDQLAKDTVQEHVQGEQGPSTILVNRGFLTTAKAKEYREQPGIVPGVDGEDVYIQTLLRPASDIKPGVKPMFTPDNDKLNNEWFYIDLEGMKSWVEEKALGRAKVQGVLVDEIYDGPAPYQQLMQSGVPVGRPPAVELRNNHATYAATWFSLSALTSVMLARLFWTKGKGARAGKGVLGSARGSIGGGGYTGKR